jgi:hypothetical protein
MIQYEALQALGIQTSHPMLRTPNLRTACSKKLGSEPHNLNSPPRGSEIRSSHWNLEDPQNPES